MPKAHQIIQVLDDYFESNKPVSIIPAKDMMPYFITAGIFPRDQKNGLPIRKLKDWERDLEVVKNKLDFMIKHNH